MKLPRATSSSISHSIAARSSKPHKNSPSRPLSTSEPPQQQQQPSERSLAKPQLPSEEAYTAKDEDGQEEIDDFQDFQRSAKASQAAKLDLSARLSKEGAPGSSAGVGEVWRLVKIALPEKTTLSLAFGCLLVSSGISVSIPFSIGKIMDLSTNSDGASQLFGLDLSQFLFVLGGVFVLGGMANFGRILLLRIVGERIVAKLRSSLFKRTYQQNAEFFDANRVGDLISRLGSDTIIVGKCITQNMSDGLRSLVSGGAALGLMGYVSLQLTSVLAIVFPPVAIGAYFYGRAIRTLSRKIQQGLGSLTKIAEERLGAVRTSQAFAGELLEVGRYNRQVRRLFGLGRRESILNATFFASSGFVGNITILAILFIGGRHVREGAMTIGELTSFLMYTAYAGSALFGLSGFYSELMKGVGAASRLFELQDREPSMPATKGVKMQSARGIIEFKDVSFSYPTRPAVNIFTNLTFSIPHGTNVAIVGPSGGGKSTISSLLLRFYTPSSGTISINGQDISAVNIKSLRRKIGLVGQEPVLFSGSIADNIAYAKPGVTRSEIVAAAKRANCSFISDFPDGLDTQVGARGTQLSGGQKQRIAIARALVKNPDILILDEATSALDAESETQVNMALATLMKGNNTTISIAHRLSTIKRSDWIVVLGRDGRVAEQGTFAHLNGSTHGAFRKLMEAQLGVGDQGSPEERVHGPPDGEAEEEDAEREGREEVRAEMRERGIASKEGLEDDVKVVASTESWRAR